MRKLYNDGESWWQTSANMHCEFKSCLEVSIVLLTPWAEDNKGCGSGEGMSSSQWLW